MSRNPAMRIFIRALVPLIIYAIAILAVSARTVVSHASLIQSLNSKNASTSYELGYGVLDKDCEEHLPDCKKTEGKCVRKEEEFFCECPSDRPEAKDKKSCTLPDEECARQLPNCQQSGGKCIPSDGNVICECTPERPASEDGKSCTVSDNECKEKLPDCIETWGKCIRKGVELFCECPPDRPAGKEGKSCTVLKEECRKNLPDCEESGGKCIQKWGKVVCECPIERPAAKDLMSCTLYDEECEKKLPNCKRSGGKCIRKREGIVCECSPEHLADKDGKACTEKCTDNVQCPYGRTCIDSLCLCRSKDLGDNCEFVPDDECKTNFKGCIESGGSCEYDEKRAMFCNCKENIWDKEKEKCREKCFSDKDCTYGMICSDSMCKCPGNDRGDKCESVLDIECKTQLPKCFDAGGSCEYVESKILKCICPVNTIWDSEVQECRIPADICYEVLANCQRTGGKCIVENGEIFCHCPPGRFADSRRKECIVPVDACVTELPYCQRTGGKCIGENDKIFCDCPSGRFPDSARKECIVHEDTCLKELPNCQRTGGKCIGENDKIICDCRDGRFPVSERQECIVPVDTCETVLPNCLRTGGRCIGEYDNIYCDCPAGRYPDPYKRTCIGVCEMEEFKRVCYDKLAICMEDSTSPEGYRCQCEQGKTLDEESKCIDACQKKENKYTCEAKLAICREDANDPEGYKCECELGKTFEDDGKCVDVCQLKENRYICEEKFAICKEDANEPEGYKCECELGKTFEDDGKCVDACQKKRNIEDCDKKLAICTVDAKEPDGYRCECEPGKTFDDGGKCVAYEDYCKLNFPNCIKTRRMCKVAGKKIYCECPEGLIFNATRKECTGNCKRDEDCENGAKCDNFECNCLPKTSGIRCEIIDCTSINPQCADSGGQCQFEVMRVRPICKCPDSKLFHPLYMRCEEKCKINEDCWHGAQCIQSQCKCLPGTHGIKCEIMDCSEINPTCEDSGGQCQYDVDVKKPICKCTTPKFLNPFTGKCEVNCEKDEDCENGAKCSWSECKCLPKTSGLKCERINCTDINPACTYSGGRCWYNVGDEKPICNCPETKNFNPQTKMCEEKCKKDEDCQNGAKCFQSECECLPKTSGMRCEIIDCMEINPACRNSNGQCHYDVKNKEPICKCPQPKFLNSLTGKCEECDCGEHGKCEFLNGEKTCFCAPGLIEIEGECQGPCAKNPCKNGGTCTVDKTTYRCACKTPYVGTNCDDDPCSQIPCRNDGICSVRGDSFQCFCKSPFSGNMCEKDPCTEKPCKNGGTCFVQEDTSRCSCPTPFSGDTCETNTENMKMLIWTLCALVAVLIATYGIILCRRIQRRLDEGSRNKC